MDDQKQVSSKDIITVEGEVIDVLPNTLFKVKIISSPDFPELVGRTVLAHISGKMRLHYIRLMSGDKVRMEMSPKYDIDKARITYRVR